MNFVDRAYENSDRLTVYSAFLGKIVQEFVQRLVSGFVSRPI